MDISIFKGYCLNKKGVTEGYPFGDDVLVFSVGGKMFALLKLGEENLRVSFKCDPDLAIQLREEYPAVIPGYYMNKKHWNTIELDGSLSEDEIFKLIDHSYDLVFKGLRKTDKERILSSRDRY